MASLELGDLFQFDLRSMSPLAWLAVVCLSIYLTGAISLWVRGKRWGVGSTLLFTVGCLLWFAATGLRANAYAEELVSVLLFQQITLMVAQGVRVDKARAQHVRLCARHGEKI